MLSGKCGAAECWGVNDGIVGALGSRVSKLTVDLGRSPLPEVACLLPYLLPRESSTSSPTLISNSCVKWTRFVARPFSQVILGLTSLKQKMSVQSLKPRCTHTQFNTCTLTHTHTHTHTQLHTHRHTHAHTHRC